MGSACFSADVPKLNWQSHTTDTHCCALRAAEPRLPFAEGWLCLLLFGKGLFLHSCGRLVTPQGTNCLWRQLCSASTCTDFIPCPCLGDISRVTFSPLLVTYIKISTVLFTYVEISPSQKPQSAALDTTANKYTEKI